MQDSRVLDPAYGAGTNLDELGSAFQHVTIKIFWQ